MKNNYYVEFVFETKDKKSKYLFPIFIESYTVDGANELIHKTTIALSENFNLMSKTFPKVVVPFLNQEHFQRLYDTKLMGKCVHMNVVQWLFNDYNPDLNLTFNENMELVPLENFEGQEIASILSEKKFPVRIIKTDNPYSIDDFLVLDIVF